MAHAVQADNEAAAFTLKPYFDVCRVSPAFFEGFGRGMGCVEAVAQGEELLRISLSRCWTAEAAKACPELAALGEELLEAISDASLIAFHILVVRSQVMAATDECRREHVSLLESADFETLLDWNSEDLQMLAGSKWMMVAQACRQDIVDEFAELEDILGEFLQSHQITADSFLWAHRLLISRSLQFFMDDGSVLYLLGPGQDMFNHSVDVPLGFDDVSLSTCSNTGQRSLVIRAYRDFKASEQAFYSYSGASNGRLLFMAGFVLPDNPFNSVELACGFPVTADTLPMFQSLAQGLDAGLRTPGSAAAEAMKNEFIETLPNDSETPNEAVLHVRLGGEALHAQLERVLAFFRLHQVCRGGATPSADDLAACDRDAASRVRAVGQLRGQLQQMLECYPRTLEQDEAELPGAEAAAAGGDAAARRKASCLRVLIGEKQIFAQALAYLEKHLAPAA